MILNKSFCTSVAVDRIWWRRFKMENTVTAEIIDSAGEIFACTVKPNVRELDTTHL